MAWPLATDYSSAIQNPVTAFADPELAAGRPAEDLIGLPLTYAGNFANVYKMVCAGEQTWAVKCFTRQVIDLQERYALISQHLERVRRRFAVEFRYLDQGIKVKGEWCPVIKMRWVEGFTLNEFLREHAGNAALLEQLGGLWLRLAGELRESRMAHGDLQHGNVMLVPGSGARAMFLRLIDYDGMWVPELAGKAPGEVGHPNYQHPQRLREGGYTVEIDRFSHLVIYTALRCLGGATGKALWNAHDNGENLLFRESDFRVPRDSKLWPKLLALPDPVAVTLAGHLLASSQGHLEQVPLLSELLGEDTVLPLSAEQHDLLRELVGGSRVVKPAAPPPPPSGASAAPGAEWLADAVQYPASPPRRTRVVSVPVVPVEVVPEVVPLLPVPPIPVVAERVPEGGAPEAILVLEPAPEEAPPALPVAALAPGTQVEVAAIVPTTVEEAYPANRPSPGRRSRPQPPPAPGFPLPDWLRSLGLPPDSLVARYWPVSLGMVLGTPLVFLIVWLMWPSGKPRPAPPPPPLSRLAPPGPLVVRGGHATELVLLVDRPRPDEELRVHLAGLPDGVTCPDVTVPAGAGQIQVKAIVSARKDIDSATRTFTVSLWRGREQIDEHELALTTKKFLCPQLGEVSGIQLSRGESKTVQVRVKSNGNTDRWTLEVVAEDLPPGVTVGRPRQPVPPGSVGMQLTAAPDARLITGEIIRLVLRADGLMADQKNVSLSVTDPSLDGPRIEVTVGPLVGQKIFLSAGTTTKVKVQLRRSNYEGPVLLKVVGLPRGVTVEPVDVPADEDTAELVLKVDRDAAPTKDDDDLPRISVRAWVAEKVVGKDAAFLKIEPAGEGKLPANPGNPNVKAVIPAPEDVKIPTADGLKLAGTFYPSPRGIKGPCVLMLHDIQRGHAGRKEASWAKLALLLQKQGCAVLTFDFRGYGDNQISQERVDPAFSRSKANALLLPSLRLQGIQAVRTMDNLKNLFFPDSYLPWLVQDVVAARLWLDLKHDEEAVNTRNLVVIGEGDGARLGALWLATEARRYRSGGPRAFSESRDLCGAVWIDLRPSVRFATLVGHPMLGQQIAQVKTWPGMLFLHNSNVFNSQAQVKAWMKRFGQAGKDVGGEKAFADFLDSLLRADGADKAILEYHAALMKSHKMKPWQKRNVQAGEYVWDMGQGRVRRAKPAKAVFPALAPLDHWGYKALPAN
jgi:hypothetical protein